MIVATWVGISLIFLLNVIGWVLAYNRYSKNEARHMGRLEGKVGGIDTRMEGIETRMGNLEQRFDTLITKVAGLSADNPEPTKDNIS